MQFGKAILLFIYAIVFLATLYGAITAIYGLSAEDLREHRGQYLISHNNRNFLSYEQFLVLKIAAFIFVVITAFLMLVTNYMVNRNVPVEKEIEAETDKKVAGEMKKRLELKKLKKDLEEIKKP